MGKSAEVTTTTVEKDKPKKKMSKKARLEELKSFTSLCFIMLSQDTLVEIAEKSGLSVTTIHRLWWGRYTLAVQFGTIQSLGYAAGLSGFGRISIFL